MEHSLRMNCSVVIPTYNRVGTVARAIDSVLIQMAPADEIIVVDDGSNDGTVEHVKIAYPAVRIVSLTHAGSNRARNAGAAIASSPIIIFLDDDDVLLDHAVQSLRDGFSSDTVAAVSGGFVPYSEHTKQSQNVVFPRQLGPAFGSFVAKFSQAGAYAVRKDIFDLVGGFDEDMPAGQHTELGIRLLNEARNRGYEVVALDKALMRYSVGSKGGVRVNHEAVRAGAERMLSKHAAYLEKDPVLKSNYHSVAAYRSRRLGQGIAARRHAYDALRTRPGNPKLWARFLFYCCVSWRG